MKIIIPFFVLSVLLLSCSKSIQQKKSETICEYSTKIELGDLVQDKVNSKYSIGFYPNGTQKYFVGLIGYSKNNDTTKYDEGIPSKIKRDGNKTFIYDNNDVLKWATMKKGDTIYSYDANDLESPRGYSIYDSKGRLVVDFDDIMSEKKTYTNAIYNKYNDCTYAIIQVEYEPSKFDKKYYSESVLARRDAERKETIIFEAEYIYY